ncbi:DoxX family protein [Streptomyces sp. YIM 98790]|uniref:DoxX family protein n=1 Tax=Streptomyces sp. YIM 98790 TaxID=2689077 RepID=UPI0014087D85|nr:DoxX family protein [Streptomyces sp. YIM 98790]
MSTSYVAVTIIAAAMACFSAAVGFLEVSWVVRNLDDYGVPRSWWPWLSVAKAAGAAGLVTGLWVPVLGVAAGTGLVLYYLGAAVTVVRAGRYAHLPAPLVYLGPAAGSLALGLTA